MEAFYSKKMRLGYETGVAGMFGGTAFFENHAPQNLKPFSLKI